MTDATVSLESSVPSASGNVWPELLRCATDTVGEALPHLHDARQVLAPFMRASLVERAEITGTDAGWRVTIFLQAAGLPIGAPASFGTPASKPLGTEAEARAAAITLARLLVANDAAPTTATLGFVLYDHAMALDASKAATFAETWDELAAEMGTKAARELATNILEGACRSFEIATRGLPPQVELLRKPREAQQLTLGIGLCFHAGIGTWPRSGRQMH